MPNSILPFESTDVAAANLVTRITGGKIRLTKTTFSLSPTVVLADLVALEADFTGYVAKSTPSPLAVFHDPVGGSVVVIPTVVFIVTGPVLITNDVAGWFVTDTANAEIIACGLFDDLFPMNNVGDGLPMETTFHVQSNSQVVVDTEVAA